MKQTGERKSQPLLNRRHQQQMLARAVQSSLITGGVLPINERLKHVVKRSMLSSARTLLQCVAKCYCQRRQQQNAGPVTADAAAERLPESSAPCFIIHSTDNKKTYLCSHKLSRAINLLIE